MLRIRYFLAHNKIRVVLCQLAFLLVSSFILVPVVFRGFYLAIKLSGYSSITKENFLDVLIKPGSIIYILLLIVLLMVFMLLNLTMYIVLFDASLRHSRHGLIEYLVQVEKHFFRFFGKRKIVRIFYMLPFAFAVYSGNRKESILDRICSDLSDMYLGYVRKDSIYPVADPWKCRCIESKRADPADTTGKISSFYVPDVMGIVYCFILCGTICSIYSGKCSCYQGKI